MHERRVDTIVTIVYANLRNPRSPQKYSEYIFHCQSTKFTSNTNARIGAIVSLLFIISNIYALFCNISVLRELLLRICWPPIRWNKKDDPLDMSTWRFLSWGLPRCLVFGETYCLGPHSCRASENARPLALQLIGKSQRPRP